MYIGFPRFVAMTFGARQRNTMKRKKKKKENEEDEGANIIRFPSPSLSNSTSLLRTQQLRKKLDVEIGGDICVITLATLWEC